MNYNKEVTAYSEHIQFFNLHSRLNYNVEMLPTVEN